MNHIDEIISPNDRVCAVFTAHSELSSKLIVNPDATGNTGDWVIGDQRHFEIIVIYQRVGSINSIYKAKVSSLEELFQSESKKRYKIHFNHCKRLGTTTVSSNMK